MLGQQGPLNWDAARQLAYAVATEGSPEVNVDPLERMSYEALAACCRPPRRRGHRTGDGGHRPGRGDRDGDAGRVGGSQPRRLQTALRRPRRRAERRRGRIRPSRAVRRSHRRAHGWPDADAYAFDARPGGGLDGGAPGHPLVRSIRLADSAPAVSRVARRAERGPSFRRRLEPADRRSAPVRLRARDRAPRHPRRAAREGHARVTSRRVRAHVSPRCPCAGRPPRRARPRESRRAGRPAEGAGRS